MSNIQYFKNSSSYLIGKLTQAKYSIALSFFIVFTIMIECEITNASDSSLPIAKDFVESSELEDTVENPYKAVFRAGIGAGMRPNYRGASGINFSPSGVFSLTYLKLPYFERTKSEEEKRIGKQGFRLSPSFSFSGRRNSETSSRLEGLRPIDYVFELGVLLGYRYGDYEGYLFSRRGFGGHKGLHGQIGLRHYQDYSERLHYSVSPFLSVADTNYMHRYFSVTEQEVMESPYISEAYRAKGGLMSVGFGVDSTYDFSERVRGHLGFNLESFIGNAGKSPIIKDGNSLQLSGRIGLSYLITIELYDYLVE